MRHQLALIAFQALPSPTAVQSCLPSQAAAAAAPAKPKAAPSGPVAFLFPGQGSQAVGMLKVRMGLGSCLGRQQR